MRGAAAIALGFVATSLLAAARPSDASVLCQVRKKLVVRDVCRPREETVTADRQRELGLGGPSGPSGPPGPGPGGLRLIDAIGGDVGVVVQTGVYSGSATVVTERTLPGRGAPEFVIGEMDGNGLVPGNDCGDVAVFFKTSTCQGQAYSDCRGGECSLTPGEFLAQPILRQSSATGCFFGEPSEAEQGSFFRGFTTSGATPIELTRNCQFSGGTIVTIPTRCFAGSTFLCAQCCGSAGNRTVVPVHTFDQSLLGTLQFRLTR